MSAMAISGIVFACLFAGGLLGMWLRAALPQHHLGAETKDVVRLGMGLIATMSALVLGLLIASAQSSYSTKRSEFTQICSNIIELDRVLARYGPDAKAVRDILRLGASRALNQIWPAEGSPLGRPEPTTVKTDALYDQVQRLTPQNEAQRAFRDQALSLALTIGGTRWLLVAQEESSIPAPFLVVLVCWLAIIFVSFGLFAPPNATVLTVLLVCALSIAGAIFLILELDQPYAGWIQISSAPLRNAIAQLGQ